MLTLKGHRGKVRCLTFAPDSQRLTTIASRAGRISLWQLPGGTRVLSPRGATGEGSRLRTFPQALTFSPDGGKVVFASGRYLGWWDISTGAVEENWLQTASDCSALAFSPDGSFLAAACYNRRLRANCSRVELFRTAALPEKTWFIEDYGRPSCLVFSPDGQFLAGSGDCWYVRVWSMKEKARASVWNCEVKIHGVAFAPNGKVAAVAAGYRVMLFNTQTHQLCGELKGHSKLVRAVSFSPDDTLLSAGDDGTARLWDVSAGRERAVFNWEVGAVSVASFSPDGLLAAVGGAGGLVVWNVD